ncbi:MAG: MarR family transcriptional regulator [Deltaproteobacteria bacterium]|nr:MarR family transcriptional regulator [Deltaproteobacteria bacterium]
MSTNHIARHFLSLFSSVYQHFYPRRAPGAYHISPESHGILMHLNQAGPLTVREASDHFSRSQSAMSELLQRLEKRGLLQRIADERDRRRHLVWLTPDGMSQLAAAQEILSIPRLEAALQKMRADEMASLFSGLQSLIDAAKAPSKSTHPTATSAEKERK